MDTDTEMGQPSRSAQRRLEIQQAGKGQSEPAFLDKYEEQFKDDPEYLQDQIELLEGELRVTKEHLGRVKGLSAEPESPLAINGNDSPAQVPTTVDKGHRHERHPQLKQGYHIRCAFCDEWHGLEWWDAYEQGLRDGSVQDAK